MILMLRLLRTYVCFCREKKTNSTISCYYDYYTMCLIYNILSNLFFQIIASIVTYIVVLVQIQLAISSEEEKKN